MVFETPPAIFTLTLNPALDMATETERVLPGPKLRCAAPQVDPGGGGINVSRLVARLGGETVAFVALGGGTGQRLRERIEAEGIALRAIPLADETRQSLSVTDAASHDQYRFVLPGPAMRPAEREAALEAVAAEVALGDFVVLSGSLPGGVAPTFSRELAARLAGTGARLVVDTSGAALLALVDEPGETPPTILRFDHAEAQDAARRPLPEIADTARFAAGLVSRGVAETVVVGRQSEGNVLANADGVWIAHSTPVEVVSAIGAGDSFVGALVYALALGSEPPVALQWGTAAACAAVTTAATDLCDPDQIEALRSKCEIERIAL